MPNPPVPLSLIPRLIRALWMYNGDLVICVSGAEGIGKSTLAYWLAVLTQPDFDLQTQVVSLAERAVPLMLEAPRNTVIWMDENPFYKRNFAVRENKDANEVMMQVRIFNRLYIICTPRLGDLDEYFRNHRIKLWLRVLEKGYAEIFTPLDIEVGDKFNLDNEKLMKRLNRQGHLEFPPMPLDVEKEYLEIKKKNFSELKLKIYNSNKEKKKGAPQGVALGKVGRIIKTCRSELQMTQANMSQFLDIPLPTLQLYEKAIPTNNLINNQL